MKASLMFGAGGWKTDRKRVPRWTGLVNSVFVAVRNEASGKRGWRFGVMIIGSSLDFSGAGERDGRVLCLNKTLTGYLLTSLVQ